VRACATVSEEREYLFRSRDNDNNFGNFNNNNSVIILIIYLLMSILVARLTLF